MKAVNNLSNYILLSLIISIPLALQAQDDAAMRIDTQPATTAQREPTFFIESPEEESAAPALREPILVPSTPPQLGGPQVVYQTGGPRYVYYDREIARPVNPIVYSLTPIRAEKRVSEEDESATKRIAYPHDTTME